jgi:hypothetical protein
MQNLPERKKTVLPQAGKQETWPNLRSLDLSQALSRTEADNLPT